MSAENENKPAAAGPSPTPAATPAAPVSKLATAPAVSPSSEATAPAAKPAAAAASAAPKLASAPPAVAPAPPPEPKPNPLPHLKTPFIGVDFNLKGYNADASVAPEQVLAAVQELDKEGFALDTITGVDWMAENQMEVVYDFFHPLKPLRVVVRTRVPRDNPEVPTISKIFPGANWHERETHDFFAIRFSGHPNLTPFLLPEDATYHPLRKDFVSC